MYKGNFLLIKALTCEFCEWKSKTIPAIDDKIDNLKAKVIPRKVNSAFNDLNVIANLKELHCNFVFAPINNTADDVAIICERLYALLTVKNNWDSIAERVTIKMFHMTK